jgi:hypothetical protein
LGGTKLMMLFFLKTLSQGLRKNKGLLTVKWNVFFISWKRINRFKYYQKRCLPELHFYVLWPHYFTFFWHEHKWSFVFDIVFVQLNVNRLLLLFAYYKIISFLFYSYMYVKMINH